MRLSRLKYLFATLSALFCSIINLTSAQQPTITSFTPTSTCPGTSATIFITGSNFTNNSAVSIGDKTINTITVNSPTSITVKLPANITGKIKITTESGTTF